MKKLWEFWPKQGLFFSSLNKWILVHPFWPKIHEIITISVDLTLRPLNHDFLITQVVWPLGTSKRLFTVTYFTIFKLTFYKHDKDERKVWNLLTANVDNTLARSASLYHRLLCRQLPRLCRQRILQLQLSVHHPLACHQSIKHQLF